jgi:signal peptidase I
MGEYKMSGENKTDEYNEVTDRENIDENKEKNKDENVEKNKDENVEENKDKYMEENRKEIEPYNEVGDIKGADKKQNGKRKVLSILLDVIIYALIIYTCIYLIPTYVIQRTIVDGPSMEDTLHNGDHLMVEKISYRLDQLNRFDIIVFYPHGRDSDEYYVKRIIGLPGETIQIIGSDIYINGEVLKENYGKEPITYAGLAAEPLTLGDDEYFVMGDNREVSLDSRYEEVGVVPKENIGGRAILRIWPLKKFGLLNHE